MPAPFFKTHLFRWVFLCLRIFQVNIKIAIFLVNIDQFHKDYKRSESIVLAMQAEGVLLYTHLLVCLAHLYNARQDPHTL